MREELGAACQGSPFKPYEGFCKKDSAFLLKTPPVFGEPPRVSPRCFRWSGPLYKN